MASHPAARPADDAIAVVLVDSEGRPTGTAPKLDAHREGLLHSAVSVFVFNARGELLLQRRAHGKYHSGGRWTNTACTHPRTGEDPAAAAARALREEMGLDCGLEEAFTFTYREPVGDGLVEHERDTVFTGHCEASHARPDPSEVDALRWMSPAEVDAELEREPGAFTVWFPIAWKILRSRLPVGG